MKFHQPGAEVFVPDGLPLDRALARTTHLGIGAHPDDLEILAIHGILECFGKPGRGFTGVVVTSGSGSARAEDYAQYSDEQMRAVRRLEQKKAAFVGEYAAQILLDYPSRAVREREATVTEDLRSILEACCPEVVYTHNLADKHDTHVAVSLRALAAMRALPAEARPKRVIGCEVWRDLDWLPDELKVALPVSGRDNLQAALLGVFDSQITSGKRYDRATLGRRRAHATFSETHGVDASSGLVWGVDLTPLLDEPELDPAEFMGSHIDAFRAEVLGRIRRLR